jgi:hypothetical protein
MLNLLRAAPIGELPAVFHLNDASLVEMPANINTSEPAISDDDSVAHS